MLAAVFDSGRLPLSQIAVGLVVGLAIFVGGVLYPKWRQAVDTNRDARADPYHIAGNLYFVGDPAETAFLLIGDQGHVLIGSAGRDAAHKVIDSIERLGFNIKDVKVLLAAGSYESLAALQQASGAELWASDASAEVIASGGRDNPNVVYTPYKLLARAGITSYPAARVDHRAADNETIRVGSLAITAHVAPDAGFNCTTWTFTVRDRDRDLRTLYRCDLELPYGASLVDPELPPGLGAGFEQSVAMLRRLPVDIWLTSHGREYGRFRKYEESLKTEDPAAPFIDPAGYAESLDKAVANFRRLVTEQQRR
jgi:metallo-beta-lactamase class B